MEKEYNTKHEVTLFKSVFIIGPVPVQYTVAPHNQTVNQVIVNVPIKIGSENYFKQHYLSRDLIVDLFNQITEIENTTVDREYDPELPF